ncbi:MAG TPA: histidine kinase, partial [Flavisolibacter sp.]|nr:histidine kinase [Flavisolibacter sp.]
NGEPTLNRLTRNCQQRIAPRMKQWMKPTKLEWISFFTVMPLLCILLNHLLFGARQWKDGDVWLYSFPVVYIEGFCSWYLHIIVMHWLRVALPSMNQTALRLSILGLAHLTLISLTYITLFYAYDATNFLGYQLNSAQLYNALYCGFGLTMVATSMWEADYTVKQWKNSLTEKEKLQQLTLQQEFETLKSQVNPHFLFNCFNTLSSLIAEDRKQAEVFLNELSKVYRYLLRNNEDGLSSLQTEIRFIESYYRLLKTRHGEAVQLSIETDKKYDHYLLPSLTLQLLVENAVKHNVLSKNKPLVIDIFTTAGNKLVVSNNLQLRTLKVPSNKIGLDNIKTKYELLNQAGFQILKDQKTFSVVLPLIWNKAADEKMISLELKNI